MKRCLFSIALFFCLMATSPAMAQWAFGLRPAVYNYSSFDDRLRAEVSIVTGNLGVKSRMELDFGWGHHDIITGTTPTLINGQIVSLATVDELQWGSLTALYQWRHQVFWRLYYYIGLGTTGVLSEESLEMLCADVQLGLELRLKIPLQITVDYRPQLDVLDGLVYHATVGVGVRYQFRPPEPEPEPKLFTKLKKKWFD